jgi:putative ABC transport system substrate-binding protein
MRRREFIALVLGLLATHSPIRSLAQDNKIARVGYLGLGTAPDAIDAAFEDTLSRLGWIKDKNLNIEYRWSAGQQDKVAPLAAEIVDLRPDVIVAWGASFTLAVKELTDQIPIVLLVVTDPVAWKLVPNYTNPGGNITGITSFATVEIIPKYLELLKEIIPSLAVVAFLSSADLKPNEAQKSALLAGAEQLNVKVDEFELTQPTDILPAIDKMKKNNAEALIVFGGGLTYAYREKICDLANANGLPSIHLYREGAFAGGLLSYGANLPEEARHGAVYVNKILRGEQAGSLPVEQLSRYELVVNLKAAKALGLTVPPSLLARADEVME